MRAMIQSAKAGLARAMAASGERGSSSAEAGSPASPTENFFGCRGRLLDGSLGRCRLELGPDKNSLTRLRRQKVDEAVDGLLRRAQRMLAVALHRLGRGAGGCWRVPSLVGLAHALEALDHELDEVPHRMPGPVGLVDDEQHRPSVADVDEARKLKPRRLEQAGLPLGQRKVADGGVLVDQAGEVPVGDKGLDVFLRCRVEPFDLGRGEAGGETSGEPALAGAGHLDGGTGEHARHVGLSIGPYTFCQL